jgi:hypothetical protein
MNPASAPAVPALTIVASEAAATTFPSNPNDVLGLTHARP